MPYAGNFIKLSITGTLTGSEEIFTTALHIGRGGGSVVATEWALIDETMLEEFYSAFTAFWQDTDSLVPSTWVLNSIKAAYIGTDGKYITEPKEILGTAVPGGALSVPYAPQLSMVGTIVSGKWKDPGKYNRMYIPTVGTIGTGGRLSEPTQNAFLSNFAELLNNINDVAEGIDPDIRVVVVSGAEGNYPFLYAVNAMSGRVIDTQRRRRNKLVEDYKTLALL